MSTEFTIEERYQLKAALNDLADRIRRAADSIDWFAFKKCNNISDKFQIDGFSSKSA